MPWLRDFMNVAEPPIPSFGRLAQLCLDHPSWPDDNRPKPRSLSTLFSKLDRGQDLDWLRDRLEVQLILAKLLSRPLAELRAAIGESPYDSDSRFLRLSDIRYARDIDLVREDLPPGIPREAWTPPSWGPTWWIAPPGAGRSLNRQWLAAHGLSHVASIRSRDDLQRLPTRGALFLDVETGVSSTDLSLTSRDLEALRLSSRPVCIAAPYPPPLPDWFSVLESPPVTDYLPELVDWVDARLDGSGHFRADRAEAWMRRVALPTGAAPTLGDALGLLGIMDEVHPRSVTGRSLDQIGDYFVRSRVRNVLEEASTSPRLADESYEALLRCAARVLVEAKSSLASMRPIDEWTALLSTSDGEEQPDPEWFTEALRGALGAQVSRRDLRRAAHKLKPSAFQLVRSLQSAGLLAADQELLPRDERASLRRLHPRWLVTLLEARAFAQILELTPAAWGRVLFEGRETSRVVEALFSQGALGNFDGIFQLLDEFDERVFEHGAALEASVIVAGRLLMDGYEVPEEIVAGLLEASVEVLSVFDGVPAARFTVGAALRVPDRSHAFDEESWLVSLCRLTREHPLSLTNIDPHRTRSEKVLARFSAAHLFKLDPKNQSNVYSATRAVSLLSGLEELCERLPERPSVFEFVDALDSSPRELLEESLVQCRLDDLVYFACSKGHTERRVFEKLWKLLDGEPEPQTRFVSNELRRNFYQNIPIPSLDARVRAGLDIAWEDLLPHQYAQWLARAEVVLDEVATEHCPIDALLSCLEDRGPTAFSSEALCVLVGRAGARVAPHMKSLLQESRGPDLDRLLVAAPPQKSEDLVQNLPEGQTLLELSPTVLGVIRSFLRRVVAERHRGFEAALTRAADIEKGLRELRALQRK